MQHHKEKPSSLNTYGFHKVRFYAVSLLWFLLFNNVNDCSETVFWMAKNAFNFVLSQFDFCVHNLCRPYMFYFVSVVYIFSVCLCVYAVLTNKHFTTVRGAYNIGLGLAVKYTCK